MPACPSMQSSSHSLCAEPPCCYPSQAGLQLRPNPHLAPAVFQQLWGQLAPAATFVVQLSPAAVQAVNSRQMVRLKRPLLPKI